METKTLLDKLQKIEKHIEDTKRRIMENIQSIDVTQQRLDESKSNVEHLKEQYESARQKRQGILAAGKDSQEISKRIKEIRNELEEREDEQIGLQTKLEELTVETPSLENELSEAEKEIPTARLIYLHGKYNKLASELAPIVEEMWKLRFQLNETHARGGVVVSPAGWSFGALGAIPRLYLPDQEVPGDKVSQTFFDLAAYREDIQRQANQNKRYS
jgi:chromosome segregation ATPase